MKELSIINAEFIANVEFRKYYIKAPMDDADYRLKVLFLCFNIKAN